MKTYFISLLLISWSSPAFTQKLQASNITWSIDNQIVIYYDIPRNKDSLSIQVIFFKKSNPKFRHFPRYISGDIGVGLFSGKRRKITWDFKKEAPNLFTGSGFFFKVIAKKIPKVEMPDEKPAKDTTDIPEVN